MKKFWAIVLMCGLLISLSACKESEEVAAEPDGEQIFSYDKERAPGQVIKTDSYWVTLINEYWTTDYEISVSKEPWDIQPVYQAENVIIWFMDANDDYVVWCEETVDTYDYKLYSMKEDTVETLLSIDPEEGYQPQNIGLYENKVYYPCVDFDNHKADIYCYDPLTREKSSVCNLPYYDEYPIMSMNVDGNYLSVAGYADIIVMNLDTLERVQEQELPDENIYVYALSYDYVNDKCALYYADDDSEDIGFINEKGEMESHFTFGKKQYAYEDKITCLDGHIYWIVQTDANRDVPKLYRYIEYDYLNHKPYEIDGVLNLTADESGTYYLQFDGDRKYDNIELYERSTQTKEGN